MRKSQSPCELSHVVLRASGGILVTWVSERLDAKGDPLLPPFGMVNELAPFCLFFHALTSEVSLIVLCCSRALAGNRKYQS
jgi:hypothetical protein